MMSSVETHAEAITATSLHPEIAIRLARALSAISAEFDDVMAEEIDRLRAMRKTLPTAGGPALRSAVEAVRRDGHLLGHPLISEVAASLLTILDASPVETLPLDIVDAHIETMTAVLTDRHLKPADASALVADLAGAAADYVSAMRMA